MFDWQAYSPQHQLTRSKQGWQQSKHASGGADLRQELGSSKHASGGADPRQELGASKVFYCLDVLGGSGTVDVRSYSYSSANQHRIRSKANKLSALDDQV